MRENLVVFSKPNLFLKARFFISYEAPYVFKHFQKQDRFAKKNDSSVSGKGFDVVQTIGNSYRQFRGIRTSKQTEYLTWNQ